MGWELFVEQCEPNARDSLMFSDVIIRGSDDDWLSRTAAVVPQGGLFGSREPRQSMRKFAGFSASTGRRIEVFRSLPVLPVFAGNSFPGYPNTTVD